MTSILLTVIVFKSMAFYSCCKLRREPVSSLNNQIRWILDTEDPCSCSCVAFDVPSDTRKTRSYQPRVIDCPQELFLKNKEELMPLLGC